MVVLNYDLDSPPNESGQLHGLHIRLALWSGTLLTSNPRQSCPRQTYA